MRRDGLMWALLLLGFFVWHPSVGYASGNRLATDGVAAIQQNARKVTLNLKDATVKELFDEIHKQTGLDFMYSNDLLAGMKPITLNVKNETIENVLDKVFGSTFWDYQISGNIVTLSKRKIDISKSYKLTGQVFDVEGYPIIGATVMVKETKNGVITNTDGVYEISVKPNQTLSFSYLGMEPCDISYTGIKRLDVVLLYDKSTTLDNVVITGIFTKAKESYTGSVSTVSQEQLTMHKGQNLLQTLKNIDASINFTVNNLAGSNPNVLPSINIRGNSSLPINVQEFNESMKNETNTPLIIMDGFEISLTKLMDYNDDEIQSINILKDASATAIYGSRGANGVIVVTTKKPETGKLKINLEIGTNIQVPDLSSYNLLNASEKLQLEFDAGLYDSPRSPSTQNKLRAIYNQRLKTVLSGVDTEWIKKPVRTGVGQRYNARLEGGNEEFRWGASLSYNDVAGVMKGSSRRTFNGSITLMYELKDLIFRNYTSFGFNNSEESNYGTFSDYVTQQPYNAPYDSNGKMVRYFDSFSGGGTPIQNPLYDAALNSFDKTGYQEVINNFSIEWNILKELTLRGQLGLSTTQNTSDKFLPAEHSTFAEYTSDEDYLRRGSYDYGVGRSTMYDASLTLSYSKLFQDKHQVYVGINADLAESHNYMNYFRAEGFSNEDMNKIMNALQYAKNGQPTGYDMKSRRVSLTGNANYTFDNRYYLDLSYRVDGSSEFGSDKKYAPFWSSGIGWNIHNEKFLKNKSPFNALRLKFSYGQTGSIQNSSTGANTVYEYLSNNKYMNWTGAVMQGLGNSRLTWQKTDQFNFGFEFGVWENRIKGSLDVYTKTTSNLLSNMNLPLSMGFASYLANVGEVKNNGWEASATAYIIRDRQHDFNLIVSGQLTYNKNEISKLSEAVKAQNEEYMKQGTDVSNLFFEGYPQNAIYAVQSLGIDPSTGEEIFLDKDGNKVNTWNAADKVFQGSADPKYRGNASMALIWKDFTFNMSWGFYWGGKRYNSTLLDKVEVTYTELMNSNVDERVMSQRWFQPGDHVFFNKLSNIKTRASSRYVMDDNVLELQSISLQYRWDTPGLKRAIGASSVIFGVNMSDIFHFSSIKMERGTAYPFARTIQGSVKLSF
ncbi:MAG: SusC/RagA family TonB-linked outer membrane protein [Bacteroides sp.]|nr:SusC/RagA family TonB-linked outer membrane protein [Bacteroides sp.]